MTKHRKTVLAREDYIVPPVDVPFAKVGGVMAQRDLSLRNMENNTGIPFGSIRTWLQGGIKKPGYPQKIHREIEQKLGITIIESPYEE